MYELLQNILTYTRNKILGVTSYSMFDVKLGLFLKKFTFTVILKFTLSSGPRGCDGAVDKD